MASFRSLVITEKGQALIAKIIAGTATPKFTKVSCSETDYSDYNNEQLQECVTLSDVRQIVNISEVTRINQSEIKISVVLTNSALDEGYYLKTIGLYAVDPSEGEILYGVATATVPDWMPSNDINVSSISFDLITKVSNLENISLEVDPVAVATERQLESVKRNANIASENNTEAIREAIPSGFTKFNEIDFSFGTRNPNKIKLTGKGVAFVNGFKVVIPDSTVIDVGEPPTEGDRDDLVFLEVWKSQDSEMGESVQSRIRVVQGVDFEKYGLEGFHKGTFSTIESAFNSLVTPMGGNFEPLLADFTTVLKKSITVFYPSILRESISNPSYPLISASDKGLLVAGNGTQTSKDLLKTADGYVYAIPMFKVSRRNSGGYGVSNPNGGREYFSTSIMSHFSKGDHVINVNSTEGFEVGDKVYSRDSYLTYLFQVTSINSSTQLGVIESSKWGDDNTGWWIELKASECRDGRSDNVFCNIIYDRDVLDLRHQVSLTGFNYQQLLEENFDKLLKGELQTKEKEKMVKTYHGIPKTPIDEHTVFYASFDGTTVAEVGNLDQFTLPKYIVGASGIGLYARDKSNGNNIPKTRNLAQSSEKTFDMLVSDDYLLGGGSATTNYLLQFAEAGDEKTESDVNYGYKVLLGFSKTTKVFKIMYRDVVEDKSIYANCLSVELRGMNHIRYIIKSDGTSKLYFNGIKVIEGVMQFSAGDTIDLSRLSIATYGDPYNYNYSPSGLIQDISISNIDRGDVFTTLPQDFIDGHATIMPAMNGQRKVYSDALTSQYTVGIAKGNGEDHSKGIEVTQATKGQWTSGDTIKVRGLVGELIAGVLDTDTAISKVVSYADGETNHNYTTDASKIILESTSGIIKGDLVRLAQDTASSSTFNVIAVEGNMIALDNIVGSTNISSYRLFEVTDVTSLPEVKFLGNSLSNVVGTWSGIATSEAIFVLGTNPSLYNEDLQIEYSLNMNSGQGGLQEVYTDTLAGEIGGKKLVRGTVAISDDFVGKETDDITSNPNISKWSADVNNPTKLLLPEEFHYEVGRYGREYEQLFGRDNLLTTNLHSIEGYIPQQLFSFNILKAIEDKYGPVSTVEMLNWTLENVQDITCKWFGYGSSPKGNKAYLSLYTKTNGWVGAYEHSSNFVKEIIFSQGSCTPITDAIDDDGFIHFLAFTDAADGITSSAIYTDYVQIEIKLKTPNGYDVLVPENPRRDAGKANIVMIQKETKTVQTFFDAINTDGIVTYGNYIPYQGNAEVGQTWFNKDKVLAELYSMSTIGTGKVCSDKNAMYSGLSTRLPIQVIKDHQLNSDIEINDETTEFVRIPSLVPIACDAYKSILYREITSNMSQYFHMVERGYRNCIFGNADKGFLMSKSSLPIAYNGYAQHIVAYLVQRKSDSQLYMIINTSTNNEGIFSSTGKGNYATDVYRLEGRPLIKEV